jgi:phosphatidate cytidylyltransferase
MKQRIITAIIAGVFFLSIVIIGGIPNMVLAVVLATIGIYELLKMKNISIISFPGVLSLLLLWSFLLPDNYFIVIFNELNISKVELALLSILLFLTYTVVTKNKFNFDDIGFIILTSLYIGIGFFYFIETREKGLEYIFYALLVIWSTDSGAYFIGKAYGKRKLWPEISPNKTVEGSIGGILSALVVAVLFHTFVGMQESLLTIIFITVLLSVFGQIGDLVESALKRHYSVKDSGHILPGHGGILDRFDSLLFVLPILHFLQLF